MGTAFIILIFSIIAIFFPYASWYLSTGWRFKDAQPSDLALSMNRTIGIVAAIISIIYIISSMSTSISENDWPNRFIERLESDDVESVTLNIDIDENINLNPNEAKNIAKIIKNINMSKKSRSSVYGYSEAIVIDFKNYYRVKIYSIGDSFSIELKGLDIEYNFHSKELEQWVSDNLEK